MLYMDTDLTSGPTTTLTSEHYRMHKHAGYKELPSCSIVDARHRYSCSALHCTVQQQRNAPALQCVRAHWRCLRQHARGDAPALLHDGARRGLRRRKASATDASALLCDAPALLRGDTGEASAMARSMATRPCKARKQVRSASILAYAGVILCAQRVSR